VNERAPDLTPDVLEADIRAGRAGLASVLEHDANNLIGKLYAASSWLDAPVDDVALTQTRLAVADATACAMGLQAVFHLLSLKSTCERPVRHPTQCLSLSDQAKLFASLAEAANVQCPEPTTRCAVVPSGSDFDTLCALLVCAARLLRRQSGSKAALQCRVQVLSASCLQFSLSAWPARTTHATEPNTPESLALGHAAACLGGQGLSWSDSTPSPGPWQLTLSTLVDRP
jgi:hypothetical protein